jgi:hypothetical protein
MVVLALRQVLAAQVVVQFLVVLEFQPLPQLVAVVALELLVTELMVHRVVVVLALLVQQGLEQVLVDKVITAAQVMVQLLLRMVLVAVAVALVQ